MARNRKPKKRTIEKIREMGISFTVAESIIVKGVRLGPGGELVPFNDDGSIKLATAAVEWSYDRPKGRKVLFRAPLDVSAPTINPHAHLLSYSAVVAVDTNMRMIGGEDVAVTAVTQAMFTRSGESTVVNSRPLGAIELRGVNASPEKVGWLAGINLLAQAPGVSDQTPIGILVDAHLQDIDPINARSQGIIGSRMLPPVFTLIYATDAVVDSVMNSVIRDCHNDADTVLNLIEAGKAVAPLVESGEAELYARSRWWAWNPSPAV